MVAQALHPGSIIRTRTQRFPPLQRATLWADPSHDVRRRRLIPWRQTRAGTYLRRYDGYASYRSGTAGSDTCTYVCTGQYP